MPDLDLGPFRMTPQTVVRPPRAGFDPRFMVTAATYEDLRAIERADEDLRHLALDRDESRRLLEEALTRNAYGTASIEGNPLTLDEVESLLARGPTPENLVRPDEREILNHVAFMEQLEDHPLPRRAEDLKGLHAALFAGVLPDAGTFKTTANFIGRHRDRAVVYVPTRPEHVVAETEMAFQWLHDADHHPLVKAAVFFHELQGIHPFRDGNGRSGRALNTLLLHHWDYRGIRYALLDFEFNADRDGYYGTLAEVEQGDWDFTPWVTYFIRLLRRTFEDAVRRRLFHERLPPDLNDRQVRVAEWFAKMDRGRPGRWLKFNDVHASFPHVAERTLRRDMAFLRDAGVLRMEGERKGARYQVRPEGTIGTST